MTTWFKCEYSAVIFLLVTAISGFATVNVQAGISADPSAITVSVNDSGTTTLSTTTPDDPRSQEEKEGQGGATYTWTIEEVDGASPCRFLDGNGSSLGQSAAGSDYQTLTLQAGRTSAGTSNVEVKVVIHWPTKSGTGTVPDTTFGPTTVPVHAYDGDISLTITPTAVAAGD